MIHRRALIVAGLLAGCAESTPRRESFAPLRYDYLTKLTLSVASIEDAPRPPPGPLDAVDPAPPTDALLQMAHDRLVAAGSSGKAVFTIAQAEITRVRDGLSGSLAVHLEILSPDGARLGFAEASVSRQTVGIDDLPGALYDITQQMMQDMNVEFEFQVRQSLRAFLQDTAAAPAPAAVDQQPLTAPSARAQPTINPGVR